MPTHAERRADYHAVSTALAAFDDRELVALVDGGSAGAISIGGHTSTLDIAGRRVFVKRAPLSDRERAHPGSTANLFELPSYYQYCVGSAGFGVWRELAAHAMATAWVLDGRCEAFPLLYHWRVLDAPPPTRCGPEAIDEMVAYWEGSPAVRERLETSARATASVAMFIEYVPHTLHDWLTALPDAAVESAAMWVASALEAAVAVMRANELVHFDPHFHNVLTDGERLYVADFGLASSPRFELSPGERSFVAVHGGFDRYLTVTCLASWLGTLGDKLPPPALAIRDRHAPVAAILTEFFNKLRVDKRVRFPADELGKLDR